MLIQDPQQLQKILDLFKLSQMSGPSKPKGRIQDKYLKAFVGKGGFDAYTNIVDLNKDQRAQMTISIVNQFQDKIPVTAASIFPNTVFNSRNALGMTDTSRRRCQISAFRYLH